MQTPLADHVPADWQFLNGVGHLGGSLFFERWLPGTTSAPLLVGASILLALRTRDRGRIASSERR